MKTGYKEQGTEVCAEWMKRILQLCKPKESNTFEILMEISPICISILRQTITQMCWYDKLSDMQRLQKKHMGQEKGITKDSETSHKGTGVQQI